MRKSLFTALVVAAGVAGQAAVPIPPAAHITDGSFVPASKVGLLNIALTHRFQAYQKGTKWGIQVNPPRTDVLGIPLTRIWSNASYDYLSRCLGTVTYISDTKQVNNVAIIRAINAGLTGTDLDGTRLFSTPPNPFSIVPNPFFGGRFNDNAMIVVVNYENREHLPPYPPTEDAKGLNWSDAAPALSKVAPYIQNLIPIAMNDGTPIPLTWPNQNYIAWGMPDDTVKAPGFSWLGARVFVLDPRNVNPSLRCFDVTPFFALEESYCFYCWDTMDRVTDGSITKSPGLIDPPCATGGLTCGTKGSGITRFYWTVKFNNVSQSWALNPNTLLSRYYVDYLGFDPLWTAAVTIGTWPYGTVLDENRIDLSRDALSFTVSGVATYSWTFRALKDARSWPMGTITMSPQGHGLSPMCGVYTAAASLTLTDLDRQDARFSGVLCIP